LNWRSTARRSLPYLVTAAGGFLLSYVLVAFFVFPPQLVSTDETVPSVVGLSLEEAADRLSRAGFPIETGERRYHGSAPPGTVLSQSPPANSIEARGAQVIVDLSLGQRRGVVPSLAGLTRAEAEQAIRNAGLDVGEVQMQESAAPQGQVISSFPGAGVRVTIPSQVSFSVSAGPAQVRVPDLVGQSLPDARAMLAQLGLRTGNVTVDEESSWDINTVTTQSPSAGSAVQTGTDINVTVSGRTP
jgi:eukaryotic-like serine/threonine-protein kinase